MHVLTALMFSPFASGLHVLPWSPPLPDWTPRGRYVEARTASVFAGACHFGAEATTAGREALLAWSFEGGAFAGVPLAGTEVAVALAGPENLADAQAPRHALVYVDAAASPVARAAAVALIRERHAGLLGEVRAVECVDLELGFDERAYALAAPGRFAVEGELLAERACCAMPSASLYAPLVELDEARIGCNARFDFSDQRLGALWSRSDENTTLSGSFQISLRSGDGALGSGD